jgi:hypothetical protein
VIALCSKIVSSGCAAKATNGSFEQQIINAQFCKQTKTESGNSDKKQQN